MNTAYNLLKFVHVTAALVWIGGLIILTALNSRLAREPDPGRAALMADQSRFIGTRVLGPSAGFTLIAGIALAAVFRLGLPLWICWGLAAMALSMALGATLLRSTATEMGRYAATGGRGDTRMASLQRRFARLNVVNVILLFSAVWAMVFKPTL
jgi:uncharacterized membrane protein